MPGHVRVGGAWKALNGIHVKVGGAWKAVNKGYVKVGGVWKEFFSSGVTLSLTTLSANVSYGSGSSGTAGIRVLNNGNVEELSAIGWFAQNATTEWADVDGVAGTGDDYEVRMTVSTGSVDTGTTGAWLALTSDRSWTISHASADLGTSQEATGTIEIRHAVNTADIVSASFTIRVEEL